MAILAVLSESDAILFGLLILGVFLGLFIAFLIGAWIQSHSKGKSPYTGMPLRLGSDLPYESKKRILEFLYNKQQYDNRIFEFSKAAVCRETGRVFQNCIHWTNTINLDWSFLRKRFPGNYVSWGSLTDVQQTLIRDLHESLEGFQSENSSSHPAPRDIEPKYAYLKPGPLYVDIDTKVLLGWQCVPETDFEVLIVQRPKQKMVI